MVVYMISGFCAATVGLIITSQLVAAHPAVGLYYELYAIAAVVLGGTSLAGGRGTILGTVIGALVIGTLNNGLTLMGISSFMELIITGSVIPPIPVGEGTEFTFALDPLDPISVRVR